MRLEGATRAEAHWAPVEQRPMTGIPSAAPTVAIIGAGPWGLAVLDRLIGSVRRGRIGPCNVVLIDRQPPGRGVHSPDTNDLLLLNTMTGQVDAFGAPGFREPPLAESSSFLDWLQTTAAAPVDPSGFAPRRLYGRYLDFVYETLNDAAPPSMHVRFVQGEVVDIRRSAAEQVMLHGGGSVHADLVLLCTGHGIDPVGSGASPGDADGWMSPYPIEALTDTIAPRSTIGLAGLGLVAVDVLAALTIGRSGQFFPITGERVEYVPSGDEPTVYLFSRSGLPFCCRPVSTIAWPGDYQPIACTMHAIRLQRANAPDRKIDFERHVLPLLFKEMECTYQRRTPPATVSPPFDPRELFYGNSIRLTNDSKTYRNLFLARLRHDLSEGLKGESGSPYKAALECFRLLRDTIRSAVDFGGLTPDSHTTFRARTAPRINQVSVGPPAFRSAQLIALIESGVVKLDLGPAPLLRRAPAGDWLARSTAFKRPSAVRLDAVVRGFLGNEPAVRSSRLFRALKNAGRARTAILDDGSTVLADIDITVDHALLDARGEVQETIRALGMPCEGMTYFNHYLPSPGSRDRAFRTIDRILEAGLCQSHGFARA